MKFVLLDKLNFAKEWKIESYGLLIGKIDGLEGHVFLPIECPTNQNSSEIEVKWVVQHASNVIRMLPGGINIVGFYLSNYEKDFDQDTVIKILHQIHLKEKSMNNDLTDFQNDDEKLFMKIDLTNLKINCKILNLNDSKNQLKSIDNKLSELLNKYNILQSNICIRIDTVMPNERDKELILKHLKDAVNPFIQEFVHKSTMLVNGQEIDMSTEVGNLISIMPNKGDNKPIDTCCQHDFDDIELTFVGANMHPCVDSSIESSSDTDAEFEMINRLKILGRIPGIAFVTTHATFKYVENALKQDLTRSVYSRLELLTEELHITGGQMEVARMLLPQRVRLCLPDSTQLPLSDYKFYSELPEDVITRVRYFSRPYGISDSELNINCIDSALERSEQASLDDEEMSTDAASGSGADAEGCNISSTTDELLAEFNHVASTKTGGVLYFVGLSVLVFLISFTAYYFLQ